LVPGSSIAEGFATLVSKLCVSGFRRICLFASGNLVGKRILCFLACGRFTGLVLPNFAFSPSSEMHPREGFRPSCHCSRVQELSENTKRFGKKNDLVLAANFSGPQRPDFRPDPQTNATSHDFDDAARTTVDFCEPRQFGLQDSVRI